MYLAYCWSSVITVESEISLGGFASFLSSGGGGPSWQGSVRAGALAPGIPALMVLDMADVTKLPPENGTMMATRQIATSQYFLTVGLPLHAFRLSAVTGLSLAASF